MNLHGIGDSLQHVEALDRLKDPLMKLAAAISPPGPVQDALTGRWLGHPVHPPLTDVPIGAWGSALVVDLLGEDEDRAADVLIAVGIAAAVPTAAAGLADWKDTIGGERRVGTVHALANITALCVYGASLWARARGRRGLGKALNGTGAAMLVGSAWLGGYLSYSLGIGTDETAHEARPTEWTPAIDESELQEGEPRKVTVGEADIMVVRYRGDVLALAETCTHRGGPLHEGEIKDGTVTCPWHGSCFSLQDGAVVRGPASFPEPAYETRVVEGKVQVRAR